MKAGYSTERIEKEYPRIQLFPFDSFRKRISIIREHPLALLDWVYVIGGALLYLGLLESVKVMNHSKLELFLQPVHKR